jgi:anti-sigma factor RsiW
MPDCSFLDPLVTPYVDGELTTADRQRVEDHARACPPCRARLIAEKAVRTLVERQKGALRGDCASASLRARCAALRTASGPSRDGSVAQSASATQRLAGRSSIWPALSLSKRPALSLPKGPAPLALAATLVLLVGAAFLYQLTSSSNRVLAAELTADHVKCFAMNAVLGTHQAPEMVESSLASGFGWPARLPVDADRAGLELVGSRPCLYGEGRVAHVMYRHNGRPVSLFMLPKTTRAADLVEVFGHEAAIWSVGGRTFVLISRDSQAEIERLAAFVQATLQ